MVKIFRSLVIALYVGAAIYWLSGFAIQAVVSRQADSSTAMDNQKFQAEQELREAAAAELERRGRESHHVSSDSVIVTD